MTSTTTDQKTCEVGALGINVTVDSSGLTRELIKQHERLVVIGKSIRSSTKGIERSNDKDTNSIVAEKLKPIVRTPNGPFLVIAKNGQDAKGWARERGLRASEWTYAATPALVDAKHHIAAVSGWNERPDAEAFRTAVANCGGTL